MSLPNDPGSLPNDPLGDYRNRRDFDRTPEPAASRSAGPKLENPTFVVQRHDASRLHYDLRLEIEGVLSSFAVPKGIPHTTGLRRLAVRTEDHPLSYATFEGTIPPGEYGAGVMTIVDRGRVEYLGDPVAGLAEGKLECRLEGSVIRGEWHLVRVESGDWLLLKTRDRYARPEGERLFPFPLFDTQKKPLPRSHRPMLPGREAPPFDDRSFAFTPALDGVRVGIFKSRSGVKIRSAGKDLTHRFPHFLPPLEKVRAETALFDAIVIAPGKDTVPDPERLESALDGDVTIETQAYLIDLLYFEEWRLGDRPLRDRLAALRAIAPQLAELPRLDPVIGNGTSLADGAIDLGLNALWARALDAPYRGGEQESWLALPLGEKSRRKNSPRPQASGVRLTNRNKVYWPELGLTKGDLLDYYREISPLLLPHLRDRALHLRRFPDGIEGESFFHKHAPEHTPEEIRTVKLETGDSGKSIEHYVCDDLRTLLYLVNLGSIDLHPWGSTIDAPDHPDRLIFDLDPSSGGFPATVRIARALGKRLRALELEPWLKTSGSKGLHVVIALDPSFTYEQVGMFAEAVARLVVSDLPEIATIERSPARRGSKVYIDTLQNRRGQTVVPPYVVRPVPAASVSLPLDWDELDPALPPSSYRFTEVLERCERRGDLMAPLFERAGDLARAIELLSRSLPSRDEG